jgi:microcin C transport system permease protein
VAARPTGSAAASDTFASDQFASEGGSSQYRGAQGLDPAFIARLEAQFGFDKPPLERFGTMICGLICASTSARAITAMSP